MSKNIKEKGCNGYCQLLIKKYAESIKKPIAAVIFLLLSCAKSSGFLPSETAEKEILAIFGSAITLPSLEAVKLLTGFKRIPPFIDKRG
jgi:hypothetical protein